MKIVAMSDQHGHLPDVEPCDLLIVAGDQCPDVIGGMAARHDPERQWRWFMDVWMPWRRRQPVESCVVTWGNHDYCGEQHRRMALIEGPQRTVIACDELVEIAGLRLWLTPWSNTFMKWAFMRDPETLARYYAAIPDGVDILVSHQPPLGYGSQCRYLDPRDGQMKEEQVGSAELTAAVVRARPRAVVCGHVHSGFGRYECDQIPVYNVSVVDEGYSLAHSPTLMELSQSDPAVESVVESGKG